MGEQGGVASQPGTTVHPACFAVAIACNRLHQALSSALHWHIPTAETPLYFADGSAPDPQLDEATEALFNDMLDGGCRSSRACRCMLGQTQAPCLSCRQLRPCVPPSLHPPTHSPIHPPPPLSPSPPFAECQLMKPLYEGTGGDMSLGGLRLLRVLLSCSSGVCVVVVCVCGGGSSLQTITVPPSRAPATPPVWQAPPWRRCGTPTGGICPG